MPSQNQKKPRAQAVTETLISLSFVISVFVFLFHTLTAQISERISERHNFEKSIKRIDLGVEKSEKKSSGN
jgi:hypothetical protein